MGTPTYRIGPSDFFTPADLSADADTLDGQIRTLDGAIDGNASIPQDAWDGFTLFESNWRAFYSSNFGGFFSNLFTALNDGNRDQLVSFENQFQVWSSTLSAYGAHVPGPNVQPSTGSGDSLANHLPKLPGTSSLVIIAIIVIALFFLTKEVL